VLPDNGFLSKIYIANISQTLAYKYDSLPLHTFKLTGTKNHAA
jgi:hypothetical protein